MGRIMKRLTLGPGRLQVTPQFGVRPVTYLNFSWVLEGSLAGAQGPTNPRDIAFLKLNDILAVVRMEENTISTEPWQLVEMYEPVPDFAAPKMEQIHRIVNFVEEQIETWERPVVVTCAAGMGRTGTILACYFVKVGYQPQEAIDYVRQQRPGSIQSRHQEDAVHQYARFLKSGA
jgi:atypical dual specificity phosphatase